MPRQVRSTIFLRNFMDKLGEGLLWYIAFLFSTTLHEASHAFAAYKFGDKTAYEGGQLTLDPIPHMRREPMGTIVVPIISFLIGGWMIGWASVPYDPFWAYNHPRSSAKMSAAGPAANLILALLAALAIRAGMLAGVFFPPETIDFTHVIDATTGGIFATLAAFINILFSLNLLLSSLTCFPFLRWMGAGSFRSFSPKSARSGTWNWSTIRCFHSSELFLRGTSSIMFTAPCTWCSSICSSIRMPLTSSQFFVVIRGN